MTELLAGVYTRMSLAVMDDTTKVDDQDRIGRELAESRGARVVGSYCDNNKSAWRRDRKRPAWDRMLADVGAGQINAIVVYHGDRLIRQPYDLEILLQLAESKGIRLFSPTGTRNLDSSDDRFILRIEAAQACRASDDTSRRKKAQYDRYRRVGRVRPGGPGGRSFGFESDNLTGIAAELYEADAAASRILSGESVRSVAREWNARGLRTTAGNPWRAGGLSAMLALPRYAGLMPDGEAKAAWPAAIEREKWERLRLVLDARAGFSNPAPTNARKWLLSGIAVCGPCGQPLQIGKSAGGRDAWSYSCAAKGCGKVRRNARHLDAYAGAQVVNYLANPLQPEGRAAPADHASEWAVLERERAETDALVSDYKASAGRTRSLLARLDAIDARMAELRELAAGGTRTRLLAQYAGTTREQWETVLPLDVKRALVAACFTVTVRPASGRGPGFRTQDVRLEPVS